MDRPFADSEWETLVGIFSDESFDMLDEVEPKLVALEKQVASGDPSIADINDLFRLFHSLKGSAASLHLGAIRDVTHCAESLLAAFRGKQKTVFPEHIDLLCETCDYVRDLIKTAAVSKEVIEISPEGSRLISRLTAELYGEAISPSAKESVAQILPDTEPASVSAFPAEPSGDGCARSLEELSISVTPEMVGKFCEEASELFDEAEQALLVFERSPGEVDKISQAFRALHTFKGNAGFFGYPQFEQLSHAAEEILDGIREQRIEFEQPAISLVLNAVDVLRGAVRNLVATQVEQIDRLPELVAQLKRVAQGGGGNGSNVPRLGEILLERGVISREILEEALNTQDELAGQAIPVPGVEAGVRHGEAEAGQRQAIRVDTDKLDRLVDLVGELIIAQSNVSHCPELKDLKLERFGKELDRLNKVTRELQRVSMAIRMIPIAGLFRRLIRPVRDLARALAKEIALEFLGEDTEVDKSLVELLSDPLMHIIRNSADHGIETATDRVAAGKPPVGKIILEARHSGNEVWISVHDDGRGLDRKRIFAKAVAMGILSSNKEGISDNELFQVIFEPGFSTAQQVTEVSGRGVGMDVVKKNIEKLKGIIEISSQPGQGAHFRIRIPLTLAIIDGMVVQVGNERYVVPTQTIVEFFRPPPGALSTITGTGEVVLLRNTLIAFHRLARIMGIREALDDPYQAQVMIVEANGRKVGLLVDSIVGQQQTVIKSLGPNFHTMPGISGAAVMSDGKVALILDPSGIVKFAEGTA